MKKFSLILLLAILPFLDATAQKFTGVTESQYSGALGMYINPANVLNPNYKADVNFLGVNISVVNDYLSFKLDSIFYGTSGFSQRFQNRDNTTNYASFGLDVEVNWANAIFSITDKMSGGVSFKTRSLLSGQGFNKDLVTMCASGLEDTSYFGRSFHDDFTSLSVMSWNEYGLSFGSEVYNQGKHYVKVGGTLKILQSAGAFYLHMKDISYEFYNTDTIVKLSGQVTYGGNMDNFPFSATDMIFTQKFGGDNFGFGADVGAIYEYRPEEDGKYKLKVGLSFTDMGFVAFKKDSAVSNTVTFKNAILDVNIFDGIDNLDGINSVVVQDTNQFNHSEGDPSYIMQTPTKLNLFVDYNVAKGFYVSFFGEISLYSMDNPQKVVAANSFQITPRYDFKWFGFSLPISYVQYSGFNLGLGLRIGPVYFGTSNLITAFMAGSELTSLNTYFGFRIPLHKKLG